MQTYLKQKKMRYITNCSYMGVRYEHVLLCVILEIARGFWNSYPSYYIKTEMVQFIIPVNIIQN